MSQELSKNLMCVCTRGGIEIWIDEDKVDNLMESIEKNSFIRIGKQLVNTKDITGVFSAKTMEEKNLIKNGYWKCKEGNYWHKKFEECAHGRKYY